MKNRLCGGGSVKFEYVSKSNAYKSFGYVEFEDAFESFTKEFGVVGVKWSEPTTISANYFLRLLRDGSSARAHGYGKGSSAENDEASVEMCEFYSPLLDHGVLWKLKTGQVICTAMPYGDKKSIANHFAQMVNKFSYPSSIRMQFLDDIFRFRSNGDCMIVIYSDVLNHSLAPSPLNVELRNKAIQHSNSGQQHSQTTTAYMRNRYVSEYAKQRANGVCQLCGLPAPFVDRDGKPYLESHHIIWLSDGGDDSTKNTVALCPNCHRKMHILNLDSDIEKLLAIAEKEDL